MRSTRSAFFQLHGLPMRWQAVLREGQSGEESRLFFRSIVRPAVSQSAEQGAVVRAALHRQPVAHACLVVMLGTGAIAAHAQTSALPAQASAPAETTSPQNGKSANEYTLHEVYIRDQNSVQVDSALISPVQVLEGEELERQRSATLGETLAQQPGIQASPFGAGASRPVIRGMDGPRVKVLSGGSPVEDASNVSPDHAVMADPMLASQIEILRGPAALAYGTAVEGTVNVQDGKIPTALPEKGLEGSAQTRYSTADRGKSGAFSLTGGQGPLVVHVEGMGRSAQDYRVGSGWSGGRSVPGSYSDGETGSLGLSWVGSQGYLGVAYTRQTARYGLPGHQHADCHLHGDHLHCHDDHDHDHGGHDHGVGADIPTVSMRSNRWDLRGAWLNPVNGISAVRLNASQTRYGHEELDEGVVATQFRNRAHDVRLEVEHAPIAGLHGMFGVQSGQRFFSAEGEEASVQPTDTRSWGLFWLERYRVGDWTLQGALRQDHQRIRALQSEQERTHSGSSAALEASWQFHPRWQARASYALTRRLPTAEELFANGLHMATATYEIGNPNLSRERSQALDLGLAKTAGDTTWKLNAYHYRIKGYIYGATLDAHEGLQLLQYTQGNARFTGWEAQLSQRLSRELSLSVFGDGVRARLEDGSALPRIPALRAGLRVNARLAGWDTMAEWTQVLRQNRTAQYETQTPGYGMLNLGASYLWRSGGNQWQFYVKGQNLTNRLAYAATSFIKSAAPLTGRNLVVGLRMDF